MSALAAALVLALAPAPAAPLQERAAELREIVDRERGFRLARPGARWELMDEAEAGTVVAQALAGARGPGGCVGVVVANRKPGSDAEEIARLFAESVGLRDRVVEAVEPTDVDGVAGYRSIVRGMTQGTSFRFVNAVCVRGEWLHVLVAWGPAEIVRPDGSGLKRFFDAVELLPVEQSPQAGIGWRVCDGAFESAAAALRVRPPSPSWRTVTGRELEAMNPAAHVAFEHDGPEAYVLLIVEPAPTASEGREAFVELVAGAIAGERLGTTTASVGGARTELARYALEVPAPVEMLHGATFAGGRCYQVMGWWTVEGGDAGEKAVGELLRTIEMLDAEATARLTSELIAAPDGQNAIGPDWALRDGVYLDFRYGLWWRRPAGFWQLGTGAEAAAEDERARLVMFDEQRGIAAALVAADAGELDACAHHDAAAAELRELLGIELGDPTSAEINDVPGFVSAGESTWDGVTMSHRLLTLVLAGRAIQLRVIGLPHVLEEHADVVGAVFGGLYLGELAPVEQDGSRYIDRRLGFAVAPPAGHEHADHTPVELGDVGAMHAWT